MITARTSGCWSAVRPRADSMPRPSPSVLGLPLAGQIRAEPGLAAALERGDPPGRRTRGPLATFCAGFLGEVVPAVHPAGRVSSAELAAIGPRATRPQRLRRQPGIASRRRCGRPRRCPATSTCSPASTRSSPSWSVSGRCRCSRTTRRSPTSWSTVRTRCGSSAQVDSSSPR